MKKIFASLLILLSITLLAGCQADTPSTPIESSEPTVVPTEPIVETTFDFELISLDSELLLTETIVYNEDEEKTILQWIEDIVELDYDVYDIGIFVKGIGGHYPTEYGVTYNYWFQLLINDEPVNYGLESVELTDGMTVTFKESTMLDAVDLAVDRAIQSFLKQRLTTYVSNDGIHYGVVAALKQLQLHGYEIPALDTMVTNMPTFERDTIASLYKTLIIEKAFGLNTETSEQAVILADATQPYEAISLLNSLFMLDHQTQQVDDLVSQVISGSPAYMDADYAGMAIAALSHYQDDEDVAAFIDDMLFYIDDTLTDTGVQAWGNTNAASTAQVVLALVSLGKHPRSETYTTGEVDLIQALIMYEENGAFRYLLDDMNTDLAFSTPQGFVALVMYKIYRDTWGNPAIELHQLG